MGRFGDARRRLVLMAVLVALAVVFAACGRALSGVDVAGDTTIVETESVTTEGGGSAATGAGGPTTTTTEPVESVEPVGPAEVPARPARPEEAARPRTGEQQVRPVGVFRIVAPDTAAIDEPFSVLATVTEGGEVTLRAISGPCGLDPDDRYVAPRAGTCVFRGTQDATTTHDPGRTQEATVEIDKLAGAFTVDAPTAPQAPGSTFTVGIEVEAGGEVVVAPIEGPCRLLGDDPLTFEAEAEGSCTLRFDQEETETHAAAVSVRRVVPIRRPSGAFTVAMVDRVELAYDPDTADAFEVVVDVTAGGEVTTTASGPCRRLRPGVYDPEQEGACEFTFTQEETDTHAPALDQTRTVTVELPAGSFVIDAPATHPFELDSAGFPQPFNVTVVVEAGGEVAVAPGAGDCSWYPEPGESALELDYSVTPEAPGTCSFTVTQAATDRYRAALARTHTVTITKARGSVVVTAPDTFELPGSDSEPDWFPVTVEATAGGPPSVTDRGPCHWALDSESSGRFRLRYKVTPTGPGTCSFTVSQAETESHEPAPTTTHEVTILRPVGSFAFSAAPARVTVGGGIELTVVRDRGGPVSARLVSGSCESAGEPFAYVATGPGACVFEATQADDGVYRPADRQERRVEVALPVGSYRFSAPALAAIGSTFTVTVADVVGGGVTVSASGPCTIANLTVTANSPGGECRLTASQAATATHDPAPDQTETVDIYSPIESGPR